MSRPLLLLFFFITTIAAAETNTSDFPNCLPTDCNGLKISYPFWNKENQTSTQICGYENLGINCSTIDGQAYLSNERLDTYVDALRTGFELSWRITTDDCKKCEESNGRCGHNNSTGLFMCFLLRWYLDKGPLQRYFFVNCDIPKGCNSSFITLIPKHQNAKLVKDFRPISLIGSFYKIITKILANRLVNVLDGIVNEVQSSFIKDRQILDGPFILNEIIQWCKQKHKKALIFKVDFEKAYDSVRWDFLDEVLRKFGFGDKWCKWIQCCLISSRRSILVNGSPTEEFQFGKGLKQGDLLSPFLFILIMESLNLSFNRVVDAGMFHGINIGDGLVKISHMFYVEDVMFVGQWINMCKSKIMGVHVDEEMIRYAAKKLGCLVLKPPFSYLGSMVGGFMTRHQLWSDIVDRVKKRLSKWKMHTLSIEGRLALVKSVLGSMPIFNFSIFKAPVCVINELEGIRKRFFQGHDHNCKKTSWVSWSKVLSAKEKGGLGVSSLYAMNRGLLFKWIWRFYTQGNSLWARTIKAIHSNTGRIGGNLRAGVNSCWTSIIKEMKSLSAKGLDLLKFMRIKVGNGNSTSFWVDKWCIEGVLKDRFPRMYALELDKNVTVADKLSQLAPINDRWIWELENTGDFTVASARKAIDDKFVPSVLCKTRWNKFVPKKINVHAWKVKMDAFPTRFNMSRRGIAINSTLCGNCDVEAETTSHLLFSCQMARDVSKHIARWWSVPEYEFGTYDEWSSWFAEVHLPAMNKSMFEGVFYVAWWLLWWFHNKKIFEENAPKKELFLDDVKEENDVSFSGVEEESMPVYDTNIECIVEEMVTCGDGDVIYVDQWNLL
uniref:RNA-directed DNA polymerase, eukaryota n=1 Tax=Tanacetum cinerariifolium TaxID=118510 RepID=A0A6L2JQW6_TANCI|nr:RNA-directed DNA polymerase, eukaryota [Tanacetum cinerariifolium]